MSRKQEKAKIISSVKLVELIKEQARENDYSFPDYMEALIKIEKLVTGMESAKTKMEEIIIMNDMERVL